MSVNDLKEFIKNNKFWYRKIKSTKTVELLSVLVDLTPFLPDDCPLAQRAWHVINDDYNIPGCLVCDSPVGWQHKNGKYSLYCSTKCVQHSALVVEKKRQTSMENYGTESSLSSPIVRDKIKQTNIMKYGVESTLSSPMVKQKITDTNLARYGVSNPIHSSIVKQKITDTNLERYGVNHHWESPEIRKKISNTVMEKYGVKNIGSSDEIRSKVTNTNENRYGGSSPFSSQHIQVKSRNTALLKYNRAYFNQYSISDMSLALLNNKDWLTYKHHTQKISLGEIAAILEVDDSTVSDYFKRHDIEIKFFYQSSPERSISRILDTLNIQYDARNKSVLNGIELDIYIPSHKVAIEYNGLYWHSELFKSYNFHKNKYDVCTSKGIRLIQIFEHEWLNTPEIVENKIKNILGHSTDKRVYARSCRVVNVRTNDKRDFLNKNHIQGDGPSSINYGLEHKGELVAVIGFIKQTDHYVLNRYATSCSVLGGFTKLLKYFENEHNNPPIVTFADLRWSEGKLYENTGFKVDKILPPDYYWCKSKKLWHKFNWRHTSGLRKLPYYVPNDTEVENMHKHGFYRIWDCGKIKYIKNH